MPFVKLHFRPSCRKKVAKEVACPFDNLSNLERINIQSKQSIFLGRSWNKHKPNLRQSFVKLVSQKNLARHQLAEQIPSVATAATVTNVRFVPYIFMKFGHRWKTDCLPFYKHSLNLFKTVVLPEINISFFSNKINLYSLSKISAFFKCSYTLFYCNFCNASLPNA